MSVLKQYDAASGLWRTVGGMGLPQTPVSFSAHKNGVAQTLTSSANEKLTFGTLEQTCPYYDTTNSRFTPPAGLYLFTGSLYVEVPQTVGLICPVLYKNGSEYKYGNVDSASTAQASTLACIAYASGTDYFELYGRAAGTGKVVNGGSVLTYFQACLIPDSYDSTKQIIDLSSAVSDYLLGVGETAKIVYSAVTSVPLHIALAEGEYSLTINGSSGVATSGSPATLSPNNTSYTGKFSRAQMYVGIGDTTVTAYTATAENLFIVASGLVLKAEAIISTKTTLKIVSVLNHFFDNNTKKYHGNRTLVWDDTATIWSSLGTITFPFAQSGIIIIKRIA